MTTEKHLWLKEKLSRIAPHETEKLAELCDEICYEKGGWTALKLISLMLYASVYINILKDRKIFDKLIYIDAFSGSGIVKVEVSTKKYVLLGSSLLVPALYDHFFYKTYFFDKNKKYIKCLRNRLEETVEDFSDEKYILKVGDANKNLIETLENIEKKTHYLAFIDPEGMELDWVTMEALLKRRGDIIFNFNAGINRASAAGYAEKMNKFFGCDDWKGLNTHEEFLELYIERINSVSRSVVQSLDIKRTKNEKKYSLLFIAPKTGSGSPWLKNIVDHLKRKTKGNYENEVKNMLAILHGDLKTLDDFLPKNNEGIKTLDEFLN